MSEWKFKPKVFFRIWINIIESLCWSYNPKYFEGKLKEKIREKLAEIFPTKFVTMEQPCRFDIAITSHENLVYDDPSDFYPREIYVLLEHESDGRMVLDKIHKLVCHRAMLKVLVFYVAKTSYKKPIEYVSECARAIREFNSKLSEDPRTKYLLIIGLEAKNGHITTWLGFEINTKGNIKHIS